MNSNITIQKQINELAKTSHYGSVNELRIIIAAERAVARLQTFEKTKDILIFKGGFVLVKTTNTNRFTRDLDATILEVNKSNVSILICEAMKIDLNDGVWYGTPKISPLKIASKYGGFQFSIPFQIGIKPSNEAKIAKLSRFSIDIGIGDSIISEQNIEPMRSIIDCFEPVSWKIYPPEFIISEKLEALISRGYLNSRAKDIYDIVLLAPKCENKLFLKTAIITTFKHRETPLHWPLFPALNSMPLDIMETAWRSVKLRVPMDFKNIWEQFLEQIKISGINMEALGQSLQIDGLKIFTESFDKLINLMK